MKMAVIGSGAVGTAIASALDTNDVTLLGRQSKTMTFEERETGEKKPIAVQSLSNTSSQFDVIFIAVKTHQLDTILADLKRITHDQSKVILAQNGNGLLSKLGDYDAYQAVVYISGEKKEDYVRHDKDYRIHLKRDAFTEQLKAEIASSMLTLQLEDNIEKAIWFKLIFNLGMNTLTALSRDTARLLKDEKMVHLCKNLLKEGLKVANAEGITYEASFVDDVIAAYRIFSEESATSMYYDTMNDRVTEVEAIQGYIYKQGQKHQLEIPYIETTYTLLAHQNEVRQR
ncbi:oxidoreductase [Staphylococcus lutrae]|uniref:2-dehydropantoate 2-reductase n=1 Tax=Staphylococcus lutrae TaxID=155085 RepID=A0AAC9WJZ2_9STAP|nr:2-dehydropantoate 2-reductase [Staphylococcus lutrae]PNZ34831.1 2-dehydropantoate 2-reductase [Staphylococcus lutrae]